MKAPNTKTTITTDRKNMFSIGERSGESSFTKAFISAKQNEDAAIEKMPKEVWEYCMTSP